MIQLAFYKARYGTLFDKLISLTTISQYSHCEIVFPNGQCASSSVRDGGIRIKNISMNEHWDVYNLSEFLEPDESKIRNWFDINNDDIYDWLGAIGSTFKLDWTSEDKKFCSYACAIVLGIDPIITPGGLYRYLNKNKLITYASPIT